MQEDSTCDAFIYFPVADHILPVYHPPARTIQPHYACRDARLPQEALQRSKSY